MIFNEFYLNYDANLKNGKYRYGSLHSMILIIEIPSIEYLEKIYNYIVSRRLCFYDCVATNKNEVINNVMDLYNFQNPYIIKKWENPRNYK